MKELEQRGYTHIEYLLEGGEGNVYTCEKDGAKYLVKAVAALEPEQLDILKSINALRDEYFPRIGEIVDSGEHTLIIREYIEGTTLADEIKKNSPYSYIKAKEIIYNICNALRALHTMKPHPIIYRDLKPENIIITPEGNIRLIDFGIARYYKQEAVRDTVPAGTKGYTAPEVMAGMQSDERSDIYSVGLLLYELLSGKSLQDPPYQIRPVAESNEYIPDYIDEVIAKATDVNQTNRYATIDEFVHELNSIKEIKEVRKKKRRNKRILIAVSAVATVVLAAVIIASTLFGEKTETLLSLTFDNEQDAYYLGNSGFPQGEFEVKDGALRIMAEGCNLEYKPTNGQLVRFRLKSSGCGSVALGQYRIETNLMFDCSFHDEAQNADMTTGEKSLKGIPIVNTEQWLDCILYTNEQNSAVYAVVCDNESGSIEYTGFQIPERFNEDVEYAQTGGAFFVNILAFFENENDYILVDSIDIAEGSLRQYLKEHMPAYAQHAAKVDAFLSQDIKELPEMVLQPVEP